MRTALASGIAALRQVGIIRQGRGEGTANATARHLSDFAPIEAFNTEMRFFVGQCNQSAILLILNQGFYAIADRRLNTSLICRGIKFVKFV